MSVENIGLSLDAQTCVEEASLQDFLREQKPACSIEADLFLSDRLRA